MSRDYYVYVYIDPRNYDEFYYGKGRGNRKLAHLKDDTDTEKTKIIKQIHKEGLEPIIKVIAADLTQSEALLIEKTLIWKLGKSLTNISSGHYANKFCPQNTLHKNIPYFDYSHGVYHVNVGECKYRVWSDSYKYNFISAGQGEKWSKPLQSLNKGDIIVAYLNGYGYVGVGRVSNTAVRSKNFRYKGTLLSECDLDCPNIFSNCENAELSEYIIAIDWIKKITAKKAKSMNKKKLFIPRGIKALLDNQPKTTDFINKEFEVDLYKLTNED